MGGAKVVERYQAIDNILVIEIIIERLSILHIDIHRIVTQNSDTISIALGGGCYFLCCCTIYMAGNCKQLLMTHERLLAKCQTLGRLSFQATTMKKKRIDEKCRWV